MAQKGSRVAAIYDVHGNLPALEAVLAELESVNPDLIVVGGTWSLVQCPPRSWTAW
jgi:Icc-related predicted phosphoesterase